jgi:uncharacterized membrane protein
MKSIASYFLQGLLYTIPVAVTAYVLYWLFMELDQLLSFETPGLGILLILLGITMIGFLGSFLIQLPFVNFIDNQLERLPLVNTIYTSSKDMLKAVVGQKQGFNRPVLVKLSAQAEVRRIGFITDEGLSLLDHEEMPLVTVYLPFSISVSGQVFLVPPHFVEPLAGKPTEIMKYVMAGGVTSMSEDEAPDGE